MTLGRLLVAWAPVTVWFVAAGWTTHRVMGVTVNPVASAAGLAFAALEALVVTLFASLWFDSLGHGGWWLLFGLVGAMAAALQSRPPFVTVVLSILRYVAAGAILAWRLG